MPLSAEIPAPVNTTNFVFMMILLRQQDRDFWTRCAIETAAPLDALAVARFGQAALWTRFAVDTLRCRHASL